MVLTSNTSTMKLLKIDNQVIDNNTISGDKITVGSINGNKINSTTNTSVN